MRLHSGVPGCKSPTAPAGRRVRPRSVTFPRCQPASATCTAVRGSWVVALRSCSPHQEIDRASTRGLLGQADLRIRSSGPSSRGLRKNGHRGAPSGGTCRRLPGKCAQPLPVRDSPHGPGRGSASCREPASPCPGGLWKPHVAHACPTPGPTAASAGGAPQRAESSSGLASSPRSAPGACLLLVFTWFPLAPRGTHMRIN